MPWQGSGGAVTPNWFSPLLPAYTDIAHYTARLLPALGERAEVILWTDQERWSADLERHARICRYQPGQVPWAEVNRGGSTAATSILARTHAHPIATTWC